MLLKDHERQNPILTRGKVNEWTMSSVCLSNSEMMHADRWESSVKRAHLIDKAKKLHPFGINRRDEACLWHI